VASTRTATGTQNPTASTVATSTAPTSLTPTRTIGGPPTPTDDDSCHIVPSTSLKDWWLLAPIVLVALRRKRTQIGLSPSGPASYQPMGPSD
jgi:hypothetical protein